MRLPACSLPGCSHERVKSMKQFLKDFCLVAAIVLMITALGGAIDGCPAGWVAALLVFAGLGGIVWLIWRSEMK